MKKRILVSLLILISISVLGVRASLSFLKNTTVITIRNNTNMSLDNLTLSSNRNKDDYSILSIEPYADISFEYDLGGANENAVNLKHISEDGIGENYTIIGYVDKSYSAISINIISIDQDGRLKIEVETSK